MDLTFSIDQQTITRTDSFKPAAHTIGYLYAVFTFSEDWDELDIKTASFRMKGTPFYHVILDANNRCLVPTELLIPGAILVSVSAENATPKRITANEETIWINESGYEETGLIPEQYTATLYEQIIDMSAETQAIAQSVRDDADAGLFNGDKYYVHTQMTAASTWYVHHNLEKNPAVSIEDSSGAVVGGDIKYIDSNNLIISFRASFGGKAHCS